MIPPGFNRWTDSYVKWSPMGSYLATFHPRGIAVWGGQDFNQIAKFEHPGVQFIDFSPCENYMVTFSPPNNRHAETATGPGKSNQRSTCFLYLNTSI